MSNTISLSVEIPEVVKRISINTDTWYVEFFADAPYNPYGDIWEDLSGDYERVRFAIAASVCEIPGAADEWTEWDCYPEGNGWIVFADNNGEEGHPLGQGETIADAICAAIAECKSFDAGMVTVADLPATF